MGLHAVNRGLCVLIGDVRRDLDDRAGEAPADHLALGINDHVASHRRTVLPRPQRADVGREVFGQHRHDTIGEVDAVAALARLTVERAAGADVEADIGNGDDRIKPAIIPRGRPDGIVKVARIHRVNRDDGQMAQVFPLTQIERGHLLGFLQQLFGKDVRDVELVDGDEAERLGCERIAQDFHDLRRDARRTAGFLREHKVTLARLAQIGNGRVAPLPLVDGAQPVPVPVLGDDAEELFLTPRQLLHRVGDIACALFFGAGEDAIAHAQRGPLAALHNAQARRRLAFGLPMFRDRDDLCVVDVDHAQHRHLGQPAHLVEGAARCAVDQPFIGHVLEQRLQRDLLIAQQAKGARNLALAGRCVGRGDKV